LSEQQNHVESLLSTLKSREPKEVWTIEYKGSSIILPNGKDHWSLRRDAKSALTVELYKQNKEHPEGKGVHIALTLRALESEGIVKYIKTLR